ncbi:unnamed protein product, partial [Effrenium voratum]
VEQQLVASSELLRLLATAGLLASALAKATSEKVATVLKQSDSGRKLPAWVIARCIAGLAVAVPAKYVMQALALLARAAAARIVELLPEERAQIFWSLSLQGCYEAIFDSVMEQTPWTQWAPKPQEELLAGEKTVEPNAKLVALWQVHLADLALRLEGGSQRHGLSNSQRKHVHEAATIMQQMRQEVCPEAPAITTALGAMGIEYAVNATTPEGLPMGIRVPSMNPRGSAPAVSIEVDQPGDFLLDIDSGCAHRFPPTSLRRRLLCKLGYSVVVLPWYEVSGCDQEQLQALLKARLAVVPPSPRFRDSSERSGPRTRQAVPEPQATGGRRLTPDTGGSPPGSAEASSSELSGFPPMPAPFRMRPPPGLMG